MINKDYKYFEKIRNDLLGDHLNEFVLIKNQKVVGFFKSINEAIKFSSERYELGTFIIEKCIPKNQEMHRFHSRVIFE